MRPEGCAIERVGRCVASEAIRVVIQKGGVVCEERLCPRKRRKCGGAEDFFENGEESKSNSVAQGVFLSVCCILSPGEALFAKESTKIVMGNTKKRPYEGDAGIRRIEGGEKVHPGETAQRSAATSAEEEQFGLIVQIVAERDSFAAVFSGEFAEGVIAQAAGCHFERFSRFAFRFWHIDGNLFAWDAERLGTRMDERGVLQACVASNSVFDMCDNKVGGGLSKPDERLEERNRIGSAGDGDQQLLLTQKFTQPTATIRLGVQ